MVACNYVNLVIPVCCSAYRIRVHASNETNLRSGSDPRYLINRENIDSGLAIRIEKYGSLSQYRPHLMAVKKITVFGGTGLMGLLFCQKAVKNGHSLTIYARNPSKIPDDLNSNALVKV